MKNIIMSGSILVFIAMLTFSSCDNKDENLKDNFKTSISENINDFELKFANTLKTDSKYTSNHNSITLIGYKTLYVPETERESFKELIKNKKYTSNHHYYAEDGSYMRVYFPLHTAIIEHNGKKYDADENGIILSEDNINVGNVKVIGRKRSDTVRGTGSNIVKGDTIFLADKLLSNNLYRSSNTIVYDLGERKIHNGCCSSTRGDGKISCVENHGGKNCSEAFNIDEGRCTFNSDVCMDYNGWFTDCENGKVSNFPGSDCDYAMGRGHCWNEIM